MFAIRNQAWDRCGAQAEIDQSILFCVEARVCVKTRLVIGQVRVRSSAISNYPFSFFFSLPPPHSGYWKLPKVSFKVLTYIGRWLLPKVLTPTRGMASIGRHWESKTIITCVQPNRPDQVLPMAMTNPWNWMKITCLLHVLAPNGPRKKQNDDDDRKAVLSF